MDQRKSIKIGFACVIFCLMGFCLVGFVGATQSTNIWVHKGSELMSSEKYNEAIKAYDKAIKIDPQDYNRLV